MSFEAPFPEVQAKMAMLKGTASSEQVASFVSLEEMALELATARGAFSFFIQQILEMEFFEFWFCHHFLGGLKKNKLTQKLNTSPCCFLVFLFSFTQNSVFFWGIAT